MSADLATDVHVPEARAGDRTMALTVADAMLTIAAIWGPETTVGKMRAFFTDDHVHAALIVEDGMLRAVVEREDIPPTTDDQHPVLALGRLNGRVIAPDTPLELARLRMLHADRRRLAVAAADGRYLGLLCLKRTAAGFCSDDNVRARAAAAAPVRAPGHANGPPTDPLSARGRAEPNGDSRPD
jgi:hypothetical protein